MDTPMAALVIQRGDDFVISTPWHFSDSLTGLYSRTPVRLGDGGTPWGPRGNALLRGVTSNRGDIVAVVIGRGRELNYSLLNRSPSYLNNWVNAAKQSPLSGGLGVSEIYQITNRESGACTRVD